MNGCSCIGSHGDRTERGRCEEAACSLPKFCKAAASGGCGDACLFCTLLCLHGRRSAAMECIPRHRCLGMLNTWLACAGLGTTARANTGGRHSCRRVSESAADSFALEHLLGGKATPHVLLQVAPDRESLRIRTHPDKPGHHTLFAWRMVTLGDVPG